MCALVDEDVHYIKVRAEITKSKRSEQGEFVALYTHSQHCCLVISGYERGFHDSSAFV